MKKVDTFIKRDDVMEILRTQHIKTGESIERVGWQNVHPTAPINNLISNISCLPTVEIDTKWIPLDEDKPRKGMHVLYLYKVDGIYITPTGVPENRHYVVESGWACKDLNDTAIAWMPFIPYFEE